MVATMTSSIVRLRSGHWTTREANGRKIAVSQSKTSFIGAKFGEEKLAILPILPILLLSRY